MADPSTVHFICMCPYFCSLPLPYCHLVVVMFIVFVQFCCVLVLAVFGVVDVKPLVLESLLMVRTSVELVTGW